MSSFAIFWNRWLGRLVIHKKGPGADGATMFSNKRNGTLTVLPSFPIPLRCCNVIVPPTPYPPLNTAESTTGVSPGADVGDFVGDLVGAVLEMV